METTIKSIGITGASGNIGTILQNGLSSKYRLSLFDLKKSKTIPNVKSITVDFGERKQLKGIFDGLDAIIHLAGDPRPNAPRQSTLRNNFTATSHVFEEALHSGVKKVVFASSNFYHEGDITEVLGSASGQLITLDRNPTPKCLYGESKVFGEHVGRHLSHLGVKFAALRIGWAVPQNNPALYGGAYMRAVFCSHHDLVEAFSKALESEKDFLVAFAVSNNERAVFDLAETREQLGFYPRDNAESYF